MNDLAVFNFDNNLITATIYKGKPAFVAMDVARALGYATPQKAIKDHCKSLIKIKCHEAQKLGFGLRPQGVTLLPVEGLCGIVLASKNQSFVRFLKEEVAEYFNEYGSFCETISALCIIDHKIRKDGIREKAALDTIEQLLGVKLKRQYRVGKYRIDGYDSINNVAYEIDEEQHFTPQHMDADKVREKEIFNKLGCKFVRIKV